MRASMRELQKLERVKGIEPSYTYLYSQCHISLIFHTFERH